MLMVVYGICRMVLIIHAQPMLMGRKLLLSYHVLGDSKVSKKKISYKFEWQYTYLAMIDSQSIRQTSTLFGLLEDSVTSARV